jgi:transcriptional regulator with XRE-family HTH domain
LPESGHRDADLLLLGRAVREMREQHGKSADELAAAAGMSRRRIDALESGDLDPTYEILLAIADAIGIRPSALFMLVERLKASDER